VRPRVEVDRPAGGVVVGEAAEIGGAYAIPRTGQEGVPVDYGQFEGWQLIHRWGRRESSQLAARAGDDPGAEREPATNDLEAGAPPRMDVSSALQFPSPLPVPSDEPCGRLGAPVGQSRRGLVAAAGGARLGTADARLQRSKTSGSAGAEAALWAWS
jgi:hypothetical protein